VSGPRVIRAYVAFVLGERGHHVSQESSLTGTCVDIHVEEHKRDVVGVEEIEELAQMPQRAAESRQFWDDYGGEFVSSLDELLETGPWSAPRRPE
jgi:hypothetical protein